MIAEHTLRQSHRCELLLIGFNRIDEWHKSDELLQRRGEYRALLEWLIDRKTKTARRKCPSIPSARRPARAWTISWRTSGSSCRGRPYPNDQVTDLNLRFLVTEAIREQALNLLHQEVSHSIAVAVTDSEERDENMTYIAATIYVERHSQKGIVLGQKGSMIKQLGQAARPHIEELVGTKVYLELWVKVLEKWRAKENLLQRLGYT